MKTKFNKKCIIKISMIAVTSFVFFSPCYAANTVKVNVETANIRKEANADASILDQVSKGQEVEILEQSGEWYKIKFNKIEGYLRKDLLEESEKNTQVTESETPKEEIKNEETKVEEKTQQQIQTEGQTESQTESKETVMVYTCKENTKLKIIPLIIGKNIQEVGKDTQLKVLEINNKWALVECGSNRGWILVSKIEKVESTNNTINTTEQENSNQEEKKEEEKAQEEAKEEKKEETPKTEAQKEKTMYINGDVVNLRKSESTSSESVAKLTKGTQVTVVSTNNGWSCVKVNSKQGYISTSLLSDKKPEAVTSRSLEEERKETQTNNTQKEEKTSAGNASEICSYAKQYLGSKYVYGGTTPSGFDCSGFTQYVYKHFGVSLNRTAEAQASNGTAVSKSNLKAGDLVIFTSHVGIYLGDGTFIHAANPQKGVIITSLSDSYYVKNYITSRRVIN